MPFAHGGSAISGLFEHGGKSHRALVDEKSAGAIGNAGSGCAPGVFPSEHAVPARGAGGGGGVAIGKTNPGVCNAIDAGSWDDSRAVGGDVSVSDIVAVDDDNVGFGGKCGRRGGIPRRRGE